MSSCAEFVAKLCHYLSRFLSWLVHLVHSIASSLEPAQPPPELPLATLEPRSTIPIMGIPYSRIQNDVMQRLQTGPPMKLLSDSSGNTQERSSHRNTPRANSYRRTYLDAHEPRATFATGSVISTLDSTPSPTLSIYTPLLSYSSSPTPLSSPCPSPTTGFSDRGSIYFCDENRLSVPNLDVQIGSLGKRRGFKGAPLHLKSSLLVLPSSLSLFSPRSSPDYPSTPRSPLEAVTNMIRTKRSFIKDVSQDRHDFYDDADPFSTFSNTFFTSSMSFDIVPTSNIDSLTPYESGYLSPTQTPSLKRKPTFAARTASHSKGKYTMKTTIYDLSIADVPAKPIVLKKPKLKSKPRKKSTTSPRFSPKIVLTLPSLPPSPSSTVRSSVRPNASVAQCASTSNAAEEDGSDDGDDVGNAPVSDSDDDGDGNRAPVILPARPPLPVLGSHDRYSFGASLHPVDPNWTPPVDRSVHVDLQNADPGRSAECTTTKDRSNHEVFPITMTRGHSLSGEAKLSPFNSTSSCPSFIREPLLSGPGFLPSIPLDASIHAQERQVLSHKRNHTIANVHNTVTLGETGAFVDYRTGSEDVGDGGIQTRRPKNAYVPGTFPLEDENSIIIVPAATDVPAEDTAPVKQWMAQLPALSTKHKRAITNFRAASISWTLPDKPYPQGGHGRHRRSVAMDDKTGKGFSMSMSAGVGKQRRTMTTLDGFTSFGIHPFQDIHLPHRFGPVVTSAAIDTGKQMVPPDRHMDWTSPAQLPGHKGSVADSNGNPMVDADAGHVNDFEGSPASTSTLRGSEEGFTQKRHSRALGDIISLLEDTYKARPSPGYKSDSVATSDMGWNFAGYAI